jgi:hypothetical protein
LQNILQQRVKIKKAMSIFKIPKGWWNEVWFRNK